ncbi:Cytochrome c553 [Marinospirillum celere]|uniref:Cytochrome c553 n=1 Tax=Marinospirillum celere TaxID=1122252 RepID=A0A1I1FGP5_9GAMM|nr:c-type cytochrome [Marinospirillum celere]SFB98474.1 Cytochrome c553 [Marinospirillum celere]
MFSKKTKKILNSVPNHLKTGFYALVLGGFLISSAQAEGFSQRQVEVMAGSCANCHGTEGRLAGVVPAIAKRPAGVLEAQLLAFKRDEEPRATVMDRIAKGYTEEELRALAHYFANLDNK